LLREIFNITSAAPEKRQKKKITITTTKMTTSLVSRLGTLRVFGPDSNGIVAACSRLLGRHGYSIVKSEQWTDRKDNMFFQRFAFSHENNNNAAANNTIIDNNNNSRQRECEEELQDICQRFQLQSHLNWRDKRKKVGILVSNYDHCLWELLLRHSAHELDMDIEVVISNHETLRHVADAFHLPYHVTPITQGTKEEQEAIQLELLKDVDVVVMARYMQVLSENFLNHFPNQVINIHHSFLPAFQGGSPYHRAWERGVKLIGATAHYATLDLDEGPIIEQDVIQVSHRDEVQDMMRKGRILERNVLIKALEAHLDDRIIVYKNRCIVFND
jgi:formyltetrahydrofolate deformylase